jgi:hypothetical protein
MGSTPGNRGKAAPKIEENQREEKQLQSGQTVAEQLESGQVDLENGWIMDQPD